MSEQAKLPPGQKETSKFPVLHAGSVPKIELEKWRFKTFGLVDNPLNLSYAEMTALPGSKIVCDIHCVTRWSKLNTHWEGIPVKTILDMTKPKPAAFYALIHAENDFTTNLPLELLYEKDSIFAFKYEGKPLTEEHGWPMRLIVPQRYFWKSAKWVTGIELTESDAPGFWEKHGYHMEGDPWKEERYSSPRPW